LLHVPYITFLSLPWTHSYRDCGKRAQPNTFLKFRRGISIGDDDDDDDDNNNNNNNVC